MYIPLIHRLLLHVSLGKRTPDPRCGVHGTWYPCCRRSGDEQMIGMIGGEKFYIFRYVRLWTVQVLVQSRIYEVHEVTAYYYTRQRQCARTPRSPFYVEPKRWSAGGGRFMNPRYLAASSDRARWPATGVVRVFAFVMLGYVGGGVDTRPNISPG